MTGEFGAQPIVIHYGGQGFTFDAAWRRGREADALEALEAFAKQVRGAAARETARREAVGIKGDAA